MKPVVERAIATARSRGVVGVMSWISLRLRRVAFSIKGSDSSTGKSGTITPSNPAVAASLRKRSVPSRWMMANETIATIGATTVFVPEDLDFMGTTAEALKSANPRLVPLVAHDRASFGGMLVATGLAVLLSALWGYRQGERWLWWTLLLAGTPAYAAAVGVHLAVGYTNLWHLAPALAGSAVYALGLLLSYPYLCGKDPAHEEAWRRHAPPVRQ